MFNGSIFGENTTGIALVAGIIGIGTIAYSRKKRRSIERRRPITCSITLAHDEHFDTNHHCSRWHISHMENAQRQKIGISHPRRANREDN